MLGILNFTVVDLTYTKITEINHEIKISGGKKKNFLLALMVNFLIKTINLNITKFFASYTCESWDANALKTTLFIIYNTFVMRQYPLIHLLVHARLQY